MRALFRLIPWIMLCALGFWVYTLDQKIKQPQGTLPIPTEQKLPTTLSNAVSYQSTVAKTAPAVVNIYTTQKIKQSPLQLDPFFRRFFGDQLPQQQEREEEANSLGSGVIVSHDGYVLTNNHVVEQADSIVVALHDGRKVNATVIGTDPESDLAVLHIPLSNLPALPFKHTENQVGDVVLAIGNPFGVGQTVTQGIISATGRTGLGINQFEDFVQTDAAINPGNSGGALVDVAGNLVGINTAIYSQSGGSMGIGFAIKASLAESVMQEIIKKGHVTRGWLGVEVKDLGTNPNNPFSEMKPQAENKDTPVATSGVKIMGVVAGGPADKGGIQAGDLIKTIHGKTIRSAPEMIKTVSAITPNTSIPVVVIRNQQDIKLNVTVGERPKQGSQINREEKSPSSEEDPSMDNTIPRGLQEFLFGR